MDILAMNTSPLQGPISKGSGGLVDLTSDDVVFSLTGICESILLGKRAVVHFNGPALAVVTLVRWLGKDLLYEFLNAGLLRFVFTPTRGLAYKDGHMSTLSVVHDGKKNGPGYHNNAVDSLEFPLREQLKMSPSASARMAQRLLAHTEVADPVLCDEMVRELVVQVASLLNVPSSQMYGLLQGDPLVQPLLQLSSQAAEMELGLSYGIRHFLHCQPRWELHMPPITGTSDADKFKWLMKHEDFPDIEGLVRSKSAGRWLLDLRTDERFSAWLELLRDLPSNEPGAIAGYFRMCRELAEKKWSERLPTKILRYVVGLVLNTIPGVSQLVAYYDSVGKASGHIDSLQRRLDPKSGLGTFLTEHRPEH